MRSLFKLLSLIVLLGVVSCGGSGSSPKVLVIGLDGATWDLLDPWMKAGELPRLAALREESASGTLLSVLPPLSPPAWASAATGVNPGRHGIYDFRRIDYKDNTIYNETAESRRVPAVWTLLSDFGLRVGVLNVPMTDPPESLDRGFLISGLPHMDKEDYALPVSLEAELNRMGYMLDEMGGALVKGEEAVFEQEIFDTFRARKKAALHVGEANQDLDLYWVVFTQTDRIQHFFWKFMEREHPFYDESLAPRFGDSILRLWREVDTAVGELVDQARTQALDQGRELAIFVISDHGFAPVHRAFRPQSFLRHPPPGQEPVTQAYSLETNAAFLYVKLLGRDKTGGYPPQLHQEVVGDILKRIMAVEDTVTGMHPALFGDRKENIYNGRYTDKAPDLVFLPRPPYYFIDEAGDKETFGTPEFSFSAHHSLEGILMVNGPMFRTGAVEARQTLLDLAPMFMYLSGVEVPGYMEGRVWDHLMDSQWMRTHPIQLDKAQEAKETGGPGAKIRSSVPYIQ